LGVNHRDLKPENILYHMESNTLGVADFGIARFRQEDLITAVKTGPQEKLANFVYAAPEQRFAGRPVDLRADIYALRLIMNEMYTGEVP
jgi:serine/threonine protein kinase